MVHGAVPGIVKSSHMQTPCFGRVMHTLAGLDDSETMT